MIKTTMPTGTPITTELLPDALLPPPVTVTVEIGLGAIRKCKVSSNYWSGIYMQLIRMPSIVDEQE